MNNDNNPKKSMLHSFNSKYFRIGGFSLVVSVAVIAIAILLNLILSRVPSTYTKFDTSELKLYSISDESAEIVKAIKDDITVYFIAENGAEDQTIEELVGRYQALNSRIKLKKIDPVTNPNFTTKYTDEKLSGSSLIFESAKRSVAIDYNDIYVKEYSMNYQTYQVDTKSSFAGESRITSALEYVTTDNLPVLYSLSGHGEGALSETMKNYIKDDNIELRELTLLTVDKVPADADCVLVNMPTADITADEKTKLLAYLESGGDMILVTGYGANAKLDNIFAVAAYYGMEADTGLMVEGSANNYITYPYFLMPKITSHEITSLMQSENFYVLMPYAMGIKTAAKPPRTVKVTELLYTSGSAFSKKGDVSTLTKDAGDVEGPFAVAAAATEDDTKFVWFASPYLLDESIDVYVAGGNSSYFLSTLTWICDKTTSVSIASKAMQVAALTMTDSQSNMWAALMTVVLPLATVGGGLAVWLKRRKR